MSKLEAPGTDAQPNWASLYRARGKETNTYRPVFTGDVFLQITVPDETDPKDVIVLQHPCAIRLDGVELVPKLLIAEVRPFQRVPPSAWETKYFKQMPLVDLGIEASAPHYASFFTDLHVVPREDLPVSKRYACLSQKGVNLLMQRWVHHNTRVVIETAKFQAVSAPQYEEADMIEEWCADREDDGVSMVEAQKEIDIWLSLPAGEGQPRRRELLVEEQQRSALRQAQRQYLRDLRQRGS